MVWVDENNAGDAFFRERTREAPHNLYGRTDRLWQRGGEPVPPRPLFSYLGDDELFEGGEPVEVFKLGFRPPYDVSYTYDHTQQRWKRSYGFVPFMATSGQQVVATNVIVQFVSYAGAGGDGQLIGGGDAWVLSAGRVVKGRWSKPSATEPTQLVDAFGAPIRLQAGTTWVELLPVGAAVTTIPHFKRPAQEA